MNTQKTVIPEWLKREFPGAKFDSHETDLYILPTDWTKGLDRARALFPNGYNTARSDVEGQDWYGKPFIEIPFFFIDQKVDRMQQKRHHLTRKEHYDKFRDMAKASGIGAPNEMKDEDTFAGRTKAQWRETYEHDQHLNPFVFDLVGNRPFPGKGTPKSHSDYTCTIKHVILYEVLGLKPIWR